jgi:hypothetical protein
MPSELSKKAETVADTRKNKYFGILKHKDSLIPKE